MQYSSYPDFKLPSKNCLQGNHSLSVNQTNESDNCSFIPNKDYKDPAPINYCLKAPWCISINHDECPVCVTGCNPCRPVKGGWICCKCNHCSPQTWSMYEREGYLCGTTDGRVVKSCCGASLGFIVLCREGTCGQ